MSFNHLSRIWLLALLVAVLVPVAAYAESAGSQSGGAGCNNCHGRNPAGGVVVSVAGPDTLTTGETATYTLTVSAAGGAGAGFSVAGAALSVVDSNTQLLGSSITHVDAATAPPTGSLGDWAYNFAVTAPGAPGAFTLAFSGLAYNAGGTAKQDSWNTGSYAVTVLSHVPEPTTAALVGLGLGMLAFAGRCRRNG
jgi:hypothetical protein